MEPIGLPPTCAHLSADDSLENLIRRAQSDDQGAFSRLYELFRPRVAKFLYNATGDYCLSDELSNDTFLRIHRALGSIQKYEESSFLSFLFRTAANLLCDHHRRKHVATVAIEDDSWDSYSVDKQGESVPGDYLESQERGQMLRQALDRLPSEQAVLISLSHFDELTAVQIASILDKPSAEAVRAALHRAMNNLQKELLHQGYFAALAV